MTTANRPYPFLPDVEWEELAPFWSAAREGVLKFPRCRDCGRYQWYPQAMCPNCRGMNMDWTAVKPVGRLFTYTVIRRSFLPGFEDRLPMIIGLVEFEEAHGVRLVTNLIDCEEADVEIGKSVEVVFTEVADGINLPFVKLSAN
jgi:hypothetical protein